MQFGKKNEKSTQYGVKYFFNAFRSNTNINCLCRGRQNGIRILFV